MSDDKIPSHDARELADCFAAEARDLFGYACILARGDQALAGELVQRAFEAGCRAWQVMRGLDEEQRCGWLRSTLVTIAVSGFRPEARLLDRLPHLGDCHRKTQAEPVEQAFSPSVLERCWRTIQDLPEWHHAVAMLRWHLDMKEAEIAAALGVAEQTVSGNLDRARRRLMAQLDPDHPDPPGPGDDPAPGRAALPPVPAGHRAGGGPVQRGLRPRGRPGPVPDLAAGRAQRGPRGQGAVRRALQVAGAAGRHARAGHAHRRGSGAGRVRRDARGMATAGRHREGARLPAAGGGEQVAFGPAAPGRGREEPAEPAAGHAERRTRGLRLARAGRR